MGKYSKEFKEEALKLSDEIGVKNAANQLGIAYYTLADWRSIRRNRPPTKALSTEEQAIRIRELEHEVAELRTLIAESEEHISLGIVCVNLGALLIEYRPHSVRTDSNIHYRGRTRDNITAAALFRGAVKVDFTGGNEEAVSRRDIVARGIHSLYRSIVRVAAFNGADEVCIIHAV